MRSWLLTCTLLMLPGCYTDDTVKIPFHWLSLPLEREEVFSGYPTGTKEFFTVQRSRSKVYTVSTTFLPHHGSLRFVKLENGFYLAALEESEPSDKNEERYLRYQVFGVDRTTHPVHYFVVRLLDYTVEIYRFPYPDELRSELRCPRRMPEPLPAPDPTSNPFMGLARERAYYTATETAGQELLCGTIASVDTATPVSFRVLFNMAEVLRESGAFSPDERYWMMTLDWVSRLE